MTGNLTRDPELRSLPSGMSVCSLRIASNTRRKDQATGEWADKANYFSITVWGAQGENCARFLSKGRPIAVDGRLEWREWQGQGGAKRESVGSIRRPRPLLGGRGEWQGQDGAKRESVEIIAASVQFLGGRDEGQGGGNGFTPQSDVPVDNRDFQPAGTSAGSSPADDDIPF